MRFMRLETPKQSLDINEPLTDIHFKQFMEKNCDVRNDYIQLDPS